MCGRGCTECKSPGTSKWLEKIDWQAVTKVVFELSAEVNNVKNPMAFQVTSSRVDLLRASLLTTVEACVDVGRILIAREACHESMLSGLFMLLHAALKGSHYGRFEVGCRLSQMGQHVLAFQFFAASAGKGCKAASAICAAVTMIDHCSSGGGDIKMDVRFAFKALNLGLHVVLKKGLCNCMGRVNVGYAFATLATMYSDLFESENAHRVADALVQRAVDYGFDFESEEDHEIVRPYESKRSDLVEAMRLTRDLALCRGCHKRTSNPQKCQGCQKVIYCSKACRRAHWRAHKPVCLAMRKIESE